VLVSASFSSLAMSYRSNESVQRDPWGSVQLNGSSVSGNFVLLHAVSHHKSICTDMQATISPFHSHPLGPLQAKV
jgi:hypothetical protein